MRKTVVLSAAILLLIVGLAATALACGGSTTGSSTTAVSESTATTAGETTTTGTGSSTTTSASSSTTASSETTSTTAESTTTTEAARTTDTADHASEFREEYPSNESFDNSTWATLNAAPASHLGAAVDVKGQPSAVTVDPDSRYLTWQLTITGTNGQQMKALCRTNVNVDRSLLSGTVQVKGIVVGAQASNEGGGAIIYVESVQKAS